MWWSVKANEIYKEAVAAALEVVAAAAAAAAAAPRATAIQGLVRRRFLANCWTATGLAGFI